MITAKPTKQLAGVIIEGNYDDFSELVDSIHRMTGWEEDYRDPYWGVCNRLLGICYDIRHAYMGYRDILLVNNGISDETMKQHSMILPKQEVHFSINVIFIEAVFVALAVSELYIQGYRFYKQGSGKAEGNGFPKHNYSDYIKDKAVLDTFSAVILKALADVIGEEEVEKIVEIKLRNQDCIFFDYVTQYLDQCNVRYLKTSQAKRKDALKNTAKRLMQKPAAYMNLKRDLEESAKKYHCSIHELEIPCMEYPEDFEW